MESCAQASGSNRAYEMRKPLDERKPDDEFVVCKLDRFARTATEGTEIVRDLVERGIRVNVLNMGIADNTPMGKMMVTVMLAFAEYERDMIVERTQSGKAARKKANRGGNHVMTDIRSLRPMFLLIWLYSR